MMTTDIFHIFQANFYLKCFKVYGAKSLICLAFVAYF